MVALIAISQVMSHLPCVLTTLSGFEELRTNSMSPTCSVRCSSWEMVYWPARTRSRLIALPDKRLVHSESGNCGRHGKLRRDDLESLMLREKFSKASCVCLRIGESTGGSTESLMTHANVEGLALRFAGSSASEEADLACLFCRAVVLSSESKAASAPAPSGAKTALLLALSLKRSCPSSISR